MKNSLLKRCPEIILNISGVFFVISILALSVPQSVFSQNELAYHHHLLLEIFVDGNKVKVPEDVGISHEYWNNMHMIQYGINGMAPIHTHSADGILHIEPRINRTFTLADFFDIWGFNTLNKTATLYKADWSFDYIGKNDIVYNYTIIEDYDNEILHDRTKLVLNMTT